jgi:RNA polymerase sigma-70 factor (ECF subfamily)
VSGLGDTSTLRQTADRPSAADGGGRRLDPERLGDHIDRLYRAAYAFTRSREAAEDLVQDTYSRVLARPRFLRREDDLGYLLKTLRHTFLDARRTAASRPITQPIDLTAEPADQREEWRPERAAETHMVYAAIAELSDNSRDALTAIDVAGLSYREAARALGVHEATITSRLSRARKQVAQHLGHGDAATPYAGKAAERSLRAARLNGRARRASGAAPRSGDLSRKIASSSQHLTLALGNATRQER